MIEVIIETIIVLIFRYPGAFIRWIFIRKKRTFKSILEDDPYVNSIVSLLLIAAIIIIIRYLINN